MMHPGPSALEQLLMQQKQKQQRGQGAMNPPHWGHSSDPGNEGSINHGMLGLQDWPTQSLQVAALLSVSCCREGVSVPPARWVCTKCSQCNKKKKPIRNSGSPGLSGGERSCCWFHSVTNSTPLTFSTAHVPNTWEVEAEKGRQMGEANRNFSVLFSSLGNKIGIHYECFADWECSWNYS